MRIQYIVDKRLSPHDVNVEFTTLLSEKISQNGLAKIVSHAPDIVHICGGWDITTARRAMRLTKCKIPILFTSSRGLNSLAKAPSTHTKMVGKALSQNIARLLVLGPMEKELTSSICPTANVYMQINPIISSSISINDTLKNILRIYNEIIEIHDKNEKESIKGLVHTIYAKDDDILKICSTFLYIHYLMQRGNIPLHALDELTETMISSQYDEDEMSKLIDKLNIRRFVASLLHVLSEKSTLTEGFMPIKPEDSKLSDNIMKLITTN